jgi:glycosyltransferase involved in cell wall biosynthesis
LAQTLYFLANLDPNDGSAHALYCVRHVIALSKNAPSNWNVTLLHASNRIKCDILSLHSSPDVPSLKTIGLPSLRRSKWRPFHINALFHWAATRYLLLHSDAGDVVCTASFPELFRVVTGKLRGSGVRMIYEVHQLEMQSRDKTHRKCTREFEALGSADQFITTCFALEKLLRGIFPTINCRNLGLASTYKPIQKEKLPIDTFKIGYFGSLSEEQGIPWLVKEWKNIRMFCASEIELHIYGRARRNEGSIPGDPANGLYSYDPIPSNAVPVACKELKALIIPALDKDHRASIAFTKAYDYAGLGLPIIASELPTIKEVLTSEIHALYFRPGCISSLVNQINRLSEDTNFAEAMAYNLRNRAAELSWDARAKEWWKAVL